MARTDDLGGLSRRLVDRDGIIIEPAWARAVRGRELVGTCRIPGCGGYLHATGIDQEGEIPCYEAECMKCGHEYVSPAGRTLPRSSRRSEMPEGAWERRSERMAAIFGPKKGLAA